MTAGSSRILTGSFRAVLRMCYEKVREGEHLRDIDIIDDWEELLFERIIGIQLARIQVAGPE
jgi:hypothetical protein